MTFLFDLGRVLLDFDFEPSLARLFPPGTPDAAARFDLLMARKDEFEAGRIDAEDYIAWALQVLDTPVTPDEFRHAWRHIFSRNEPMWATVRQLAADGHRLIIFSNTNSIHCPWIFEEYPELSLFPEAVLSFQTGHVKPDLEIFHHAIRAHGLVPEETLYIDDLPQNIATGRDLGFITWQYDMKDHTAFEKWLAENLKSQISNFKS